MACLLSIANDALLLAVTLYQSMCKFRKSLNILLRLFLSCFTSSKIGYDAFLSYLLLQALVKFLSRQTQVIGCSFVGRTFRRIFYSRRPPKGCLSFVGEKGHVGEELPKKCGISTLECVQFVWIPGQTTTLYPFCFNALEKTKPDVRLGYHN